MSINDHLSYEWHRFVESLHCLLLENYHELVLALPEKNRLLILDLTEDLGH